jgi:stage V sporulation protein R
VHSLDNLIDPYSPYIDRGRDASPGRALGPAAARAEVQKIAAKDYMDRYINPPEFLQAGAGAHAEGGAAERRSRRGPARDVLKFLLENAPLEGGSRTCWRCCATRPTTSRPRA